ncbi:transmembrane protein 179B isoform X1 [Stigmatopora nigra]
MAERIVLFWICARGREHFPLTFTLKRLSGLFVPSPRRPHGRSGGESRRRMWMWMMELTGLLMLELLLYASCFICGIITAASLTIFQGHFGGSCMLYGLVTFNASTGALAIQAPSSASLCYFVSAVSVTVAVVCFSLSIYWLYSACVEGDLRREHAWANVALVNCGVFLFFLLISGCVLKMGRDSLCDSVLRSTSNISSCEEAQTKKWLSPIRGDTFYSSLRNAETAAWVNFFFWLLIGALLFMQKRRPSASKVLAGATGGPVGGLFGDPGVTAAETEPFFNRPGNSQ